MSFELDFVCVGAPKCGTTSLYHYLGQHPRIFLPKKKELHFFSRRYLDRRLSGPGDRYSLDGCPSSWSQYEKFYSSAQQDQILGDISPSYFQHPECFSEIRERFPRVKVILMLRDPVKKAVSQYMHLVREAREPLEFEDAISAEDSRVKLGYSDFWEYRAGGLYLEKVKALYDVFSRKDVKIVFQEDLARSPLQVMSEITDFLGIESCDWNLEERFNRSGAPRSKLVARLLSPGVFLRAAKLVVPAKFGSKLKEFLVSKNTIDKKIVGCEIKDQLKDYYQKDVDDLGELIGGVPWRRFRK
ncbi:sulfotransferase [Pseudomaricurvus sp. HS19]|uniref:sulfotransferase family protein n=1 Tax=Pseudomaricurvus sp. HS19 TaxID=2692626 RepID=UPI00136D0BB6|nr:sulfotransferase [Pseudomaricurvus sp. HS19]MYM65133.1 hypothetical protein [Pseudomaricurvus sp. HS19]